MNQDNNLIVRLVVVICVTIIAASAYSVCHSYSTVRDTGSLEVTSSDANATLSISQPNRQARFIGVGRADVKLKPGIYLVSASDNGRQSAKAATVVLNQKTNLGVDPTSVALLPTVDNLEFLGLSGLISNGLNDTQINLFKFYVFDYKPTASTVLIKNASITPGPHNPDVDTSFTLNFDLSIDDNNYHATISYSGLSDLRLKMSSSGKTVYDSVNSGH